jgi:uncharacterized repeat protein (TIGR03803 family)
MIANSFRNACWAALTLVFGVSLACAPSAAGVHVLYAFQGGSDGSEPANSNLVEDKQGNLYGTTTGGGDAACQCGIAFKLTPPGEETVLHRFTGGSDGAKPVAGLEKDKDGNLYGVTTAGGGGDCAGGCGTVFEITPDGVESVLYSFAGGTDGSFPTARLLADKHGNLFGTTLRDGDPACACGTVFKLASGGAETVLHTFAGGTDGASPRSPLLADADGNLFGSTTAGGFTSGCRNCGTIYEVPVHGQTHLHILHAFAETDGAFPEGPMLLDASGNLYGAAQTGGDHGLGTVFKIAPDGSSSVLWSFNGGFDGASPSEGVTGDGQGNLYGTTLQGGDFRCQCGTIFTINAATGFTVLHEFKKTKRGGGSSAENPLHVDKNGHIYGMLTVGGGTCGTNGCVFYDGAAGKAR